MALGASVFLASAAARAEITVVIDHNDEAHAKAGFKFEKVPPPSRTNVTAKARLLLIAGERDENGGELGVLRGGSLPESDDQPEANFFFRAGTEGGRVLMDFGAVIPLTHVNTYSWHSNTRAPQVYKLYAADGKADGFNARPGTGDPTQAGWKRLASVDTRPASGEPGGQYGVSLSDSTGSLGEYRYLLFDISRTESDDAFGNTFYSAIDVAAAPGAAFPPGFAEADTEAAFVTHSPDGYCRISVDTSHYPSLKDWAELKLAPALAEWYPKIATLLASDGFEPPKSLKVTLQPGPLDNPAATSGTQITADASWLQRELNREAIGCLIHEEVHVVQQYKGRRASGRAPGWLVEGIPDYIRWFKFEPQSHGADAVFFARRRPANLSYKGLYRISANFLNYVIEHYDKDQNLLAKINAACRKGSYEDTLWQDYTGKSLADLNDEWKAALEKEIAALPARSAAAAINTLTDAEKAAGWVLLFNGQDFTGWHNFKQDGVRPGWQVKDGLLVCADPHNAGDIVTSNQFDWFELQLDYNISVAGNSGIMFHVTDEGRAVWATGPEFQLEDNVAAADKIRCGWLYALYQPPDDPTTGKPLDATKPVGQWNHVRLLVTPEKCEHEINGVKYFEYVLGSEDFNRRVARSKFARMPHFAKSNVGSIALQGDHGSVSFRNIKIRPLPAKP
jgi:hypothetical protein